MSSSNVTPSREIKVNSNDTNMTKISPLEGNSFTISISNKNPGLKKYTE